MNDLIRHQLRELRIDPDAACQPSPAARVAGRWQRWRDWPRRHLGEVIALGVLAALLLGLAIWAITVSTSAAGDAVRATGAATRTQVSLGGLSVWLSPPVIRDLAPGGGGLAAGATLTLPMEAVNETDAPIVLPARDLVLVDPRGALFAPSWTDPNGGFRDGFADPGHTLLALGPGGRTRLDLLFVTRGGGPFSLRYVHGGEQPEAVFVPLTPEPPAPPPPAAAP